MRRAAGFLRGGDFVEHFRVIAGEKGATVNDHVNFIRAIAHGAADFFELRAQRILAAGKTGRDGGDVHGRIVAEKLARVFHHVRINANRGAARHVVFRLDGLERLAAEISDFAGRVFAFERGEIHMRHGHLEAGELGAGLDAALGERRGAFLDHDVVHGGNGGAVWREGLRAGGAIAFMQSASVIRRADAVNPLPKLPCEERPSYLATLVFLENKNSAAANEDSSASETRELSDFSRNQNATKNILGVFGQVGFSGVGSPIKYR